ncbi:hypothetical protein R3P38DRAFT_553721 [Favolaschia claudopus]|uniref:Uncharacterized protein n=1 Tax=Favolaschia claudopus TaxID=2862362 RepID=A0AAV9ZBL3_9AGAR
MFPAPPYTRNPAIQLDQDVLNAMNGSQQQAFLREIKELGNAVRDSISCSEAIHTLLVKEDAILKANFPNTSHQEVKAPAWFDTQDEYKKKIGAVKDTALRARTVATYPFVNVWSGFPAEASDEDVILEFQEFAKSIETLQVPEVNFEETLEAVESLKKDNHGTPPASKSSDHDEIAQLDEKLKGLAERKADAVCEINIKIPAVFLLVGLNGRSPKWALLLACGPVALVWWLAAVCQRLFLKKAITGNIDSHAYERSQEESARIRDLYAAAEIVELQSAAQSGKRAT